MMIIQYDMDLTEKLRILGDAAKFDVHAVQAALTVRITARNRQFQSMRHMSQFCC